MLTLDIYLYVLKMPLYIFKVIKLYNFLYFGSLNKTSFYFAKNKTLKKCIFRYYLYLRCTFLLLIPYLNYIV